MVHLKIDGIARFELTPKSWRHRKIWYGKMKEILGRGVLNMNERRNKYDKSFKEEAVKLVLKGDRSLAEIARNLGIHENLLRAWKKKYLEDPENSFPGKGKLKPQDEELRRLKKELRDVTEERDILKKAIAYFSRGPR